MKGSWVRVRLRRLTLGAALSLLLAGCGGNQAVEPPAAQGPPEDLGKTVRLVPGMANARDRVVPWDQGLSVNPTRHNHVRWVNNTGESQSIQFSLENWIFIEDFDDSIDIPAHEHSAWYTIRDDAEQQVRKKYSVVPLLRTDGTPPPDEPGITGEP